MKVAVMSTVPTLGKTTLCEILGGVFSRSQGQACSILSTGNTRDNIEIITPYMRNELLDSAYVFKSMLEASDFQEDALLNYGVRSGDERLFIFDIMNSNMSQKEKEETLLMALDKLPSKLNLVEICGSVKDPFNQAVLSYCDCAIVLVDQSLKSIREYAKVRADLPKSLPNNHAIVVANYNSYIMSDKNFSSTSKIPTVNTYKFPHVPALKKQSLKTELDKVPYDIVYGNHEFITLRTMCQELMEYIFDTKSRKVIRGIDKWYR